MSGYYYVASSAIGLSTHCFFFEGKWISMDERVLSEQEHYSFENLDICS